MSQTNAGARVSPFGFGKQRDTVAAVNVLGSCGRKVQIVDISLPRLTGLKPKQATAENEPTRFGLRDSETGRSSWQSGRPRVRAENVAKVAVIT